MTLKYRAVKVKVSQSCPTLRPHGLCSCSPENDLKKPEHQIWSEAVSPNMR